MAGCWKLSPGQTATWVSSLSTWTSLWILLLLPWLLSVSAMRPHRIAELRQETVGMFYHGFDNYMKLAFPEDEVCQLLHVATMIVQFTHKYT
jgi:hypothetical protein